MRNDPRYAFMFDNANVGGDTMAEVLGQLFRLPPNGKPMTVMQLAGFPAEVVDSVVSVLCRMAFEFGLWSDGAVPAAVRLRGGAPLRAGRPDHRLRADPQGRSRASPRKAGSTACSSALVTQRPAELDATIISQCSTLFAMRMANERDQAIIRSAVSDAAASLLAFVPSLGTREVFAFGEGVALPTRLRFSELPAQLIPQERVGQHAAAIDAASVDAAFIDGSSSAGAAPPWATSKWAGCGDFDALTAGRAPSIPTAPQDAAGALRCASAFAPATAPRARIRTASAC